jgi:hypothetical protein
MKTVIAGCAVLSFACCAPAASAPRGAFNPFDGSILRPPASVPQARGARAAAAPVPRPKPVSAPPRTTAAAPTGPLVFPPVAPLE